MNTFCILEDHQLRAESISKINTIFAQSKVILVCDRDLMKIDAQSLTLQLRESILVIVLVCDWNIRAWKFLEAFRARHAIHLLCKENAIVSLKEIIDIVHFHGSLDLVILLLAVPHLLPAIKPISHRYRSFVPSTAPGFISVEQGNSLLLHRAASRPGDDIFIWSLLLSNKVFNTAEDFWRSRENTLLNTGYLLSSVSRLNIHYLAFDGTDSEPGEVESDGFFSFWAIYEFRGIRNSLRLKSWKSKRDISARLTFRRYLLNICKSIDRRHCYGQSRLTHEPFRLST